MRSSETPLPMLSWPQAMALFSGEHADMIRRKAIEKHADLILIRSGVRVSVVLYGPRCGITSPDGFVPGTGTVIGITRSRRVSQ
ncbi:hypothetical protein LCGC14_1926540 [marine sediment metagenome]|uniref:Uncharacterized protein n=1 Tax=marine sediment metagenome TaxID=412755 RepID=A0A0F9FPV9_9ZZZZ